MRRRLGLAHLDVLLNASTDKHDTIRIITFRSIASHNLTVLNYAILGLLHQKSSSGYDLRKLFAETPIANYSDSPGAIYPALHRLEEWKLITAVIEHGKRVRQRKVLRPTPAGLAEFRRWLKTPVEQRDIARRLNELMLRFSFFDKSLGSKATLRFLESFEAQLRIYLPALQQYHECNGAKMPLSACLALENGVLGYQAQLEWSTRAISTYRRKVNSK